MVFLCAILLTGCTFRGSTPEVEVVGQGYFSAEDGVEIGSYRYYLDDLLSDESFFFDSYLLKRGDFAYHFRHRGDLVTVYTIQGEPGYHGVVGKMNPEEIIAAIKYDDGLIISFIVITVCSIIWCLGMTYKEKWFS